MSIQISVFSAAAAALTLWALAGPAHALTMQECSAKYRAAQDAGTLNGMKWNDFRKAECSADAAAADPSDDDSIAANAASTGRRSATTSGRTVFPTRISQKYADESAGKARMHTCLDQYNANKANGRNGDLKWIEKGGGYYSECNKRLAGN